VLSWACSPPALASEPTREDVLAAHATLAKALGYVHVSCEIDDLAPPRTPGLVVREVRPGLYSSVQVERSAMVEMLTTDGDTVLLKWNAQEGASAARCELYEKRQATLRIRVEHAGSLDDAEVLSCLGSAPAADQVELAGVLLPGTCHVAVSRHRANLPECVALSSVEMRPGKKAYSTNVRFSCPDSFATLEDRLMAELATTMPNGLAYLKLGNSRDRHDHEIQALERLLKQDLPAYTRTVASDHLARMKESYRLTQPRR